VAQLTRTGTATHTDATRLAVATLPWRSYRRVAAAAGVGGLVAALTGWSGHRVLDAHRLTTLALAVIAADALRSGSYFGTDGYGERRRRVLGIRAIRFGTWHTAVVAALATVAAFGLAASGDVANVPGAAALLSLEGLIAAAVAFSVGDTAQRTWPARDGTAAAAVTLVIMTACWYVAAPAAASAAGLEPTVAAVTGRSCTLLAAVAAGIWASAQDRPPRPERETR
jgi:hypothetical protein